MKKRPNILIFNPDQFRADALAHLGNPACRTPNLDRLARQEGVSFARAFCQNPVCTPSRCSFMSGWYPHTAGHRTMHYMLHEQEPVLLEILKKEGYFVWWGGKNDLVPADADLSRYCSIRYRNTERIKKNLHQDQSWRAKPGEKGYYSMYAGLLGDGEEEYIDSDADDVYGAMDFLEKYQGENPFCVYLALQYPHPPYGVEEPYYSSADLERIETVSADSVDFEGKPSILRGILEKQALRDFTEADWKEIKRTYYGMCSRIDSQFGMLCDKLRETGHYEDTLILVMSDHGDFTGDYGLVEKTQNTFEDCLTRVPLLIKPPGAEKVVPGVREAMAELVDLPATVMDYLHIPVPYSQFGKTLRPVIEGSTDRHRDFVFCEGGRLAGEEQCKEILPEKLDRTSLYYPRQYCQSLNDVMHTKAMMLRDERYKYVYRLYEQDEFYDLEEDPGERANQIGNERYKDKIDSMRSRLLRFLVETADVVPVRQDLRF